jgi:tripartite-type tricarboxylate transporter receptor subunit TctC
VINRVGAASQVGLSELARARPDGMTFAYAVLPTVATHYLDPKRQAIYTRASFQPVFSHYISAMTLSVRADGPYKTLKDLVDAARAAPGKLKISDSGLLGTPHITALMLEHVTGVKFSSVHFGGGPPSVTALLGGHVDVLAGGVSDTLPQTRAGTFRVLGVATEQPDPTMPDAPTMRGQGFDVISASIGALVAPAGTAPSIVATLVDAGRRVAADPEHTTKLSDFGSAPYFNGPEGLIRVWADMETRVKPLLEQLQER